MRRSDFVKWLIYALGVAAVAVGLWESPLAGAVFGLCLGVFADAVYPGFPGGMTLGLCIFGWVTGTLSQYRLQKNLLGYSICAVVALTALEAVRAASALLSHVGPTYGVLSLAGRELGCSLIYAIPVYLLFKLIHHAVNKPAHQGVRL